MALLTAFGFLLLVLSVHGGSYPQFHKSTGWDSQQSDISIEMEGASEAIGAGHAIAEHDAIISVQGSDEAPALVSFNTGSGGSLNQYASNYQQTQINADGSSAAYQANTASNSGSAYDNLYGDVQGLQVDVVSNGWSAVEGEGAAAQADVLEHNQGNPDDSYGASQE